MSLPSRSIFRAGLGVVALVAVACACVGGRAADHDSPLLLPSLQAREGETGTPSLRRARALLSRVDLMVTLAYHRLHPGLDEGPGDNSDYLAWRRCFLAMDPEGAVSATLRAADAELARRPAAPARAELLSIRAHAFCMLGRHAEEVEALEESRRVDPRPPVVDSRLANAYAECRRFREAMRVASMKR
jgi:hypothetical protein